MKQCLVCGERTKQPWLATLWHFRLYEGGNWKWFKGNMATFGKWGGFWGTISLICPLFCTLRHWKYRKCTLELADGRPLEAAFDENGCALRPPSPQPAEPK